MKRILSAIIFIALSTTAFAQNIVKTRFVDGELSGPYSVIVVSDKAMPNHTIYRPVDISSAVKAEGRKLPVLIYGNGACHNFTNECDVMLAEFASHGYVVIGVGPLATQSDIEAMFRNRANMPSTSAEDLISGLDLMEKVAAEPSSDYYEMLDLTKVAVGGYSCGGAQAMTVSADPRITTTLMMNSGIPNQAFAVPSGPDAPKATPATLSMAVSKDALKKLHGPILYVVGGPDDIAYVNAMDDFQRIDNVFAVIASYPVGHGGTYRERFGGAFGNIGLQWLDWQLKGQADRGRIFTEDSFKNDLGWTVDRKNAKLVKKSR